ncbi:hypothetical protein CDEF62S_00141 [Castellaniella defragrans]
MFESQPEKPDSESCEDICVASLLDAHAQIELMIGLACDAPSLKAWDTVERMLDKHIRDEEQRIFPMASGWVDRCVISYLEDEHRHLLAQLEQIRECMTGRSPACAVKEMLTLMSDLRRHHIVEEMSVYDPLAGYCRQKSRDKTLPLRS